MQTELPGYYTLKEANIALGYVENSTYIGRLVKAGKIPHYKAGKTILIPAAWIDLELAKEQPAKGAPRGQDKGTSKT